MSDITRYAATALGMAYSYLERLGFTESQITTALLDQLQDTGGGND